MRVLLFSYVSQSYTLYFHNIHQSESVYISMKCYRILQKVTAIAYQTSLITTTFFAENGKILQKMTIYKKE